MTDYEAMRIHMYRDPQVTRQVMQRFEKYGVSMMAQRDNNNPLTGTTSDPFVTARAADVYFESRTRNQVTLEILERALNGLASSPGPQVGDPGLRGLHLRPPTSTTSGG